MDRLLLGVGVALVLGVSGLIWHQSTRPHTPPAASDPSSINDESTPDHGDFPKVELPLPATKSSLDSRIAQSANTLNPFAHLPQSRIGMALESDPFVAESSQEQQWLDRNGFPNSEQWKAYSSAPDGLLQQAATSGDGIAAVVLDARRLSQGDMDAAGRLLHAGSKGSLFALSLLQAHMAGAPTGNPVMGYALGRVMEMKGDSRISMARDGTFRAPISAEQRILGERMALEIFSQPKEASPQAGAVDPRPIPLLME